MNNPYQGENWAQWLPIHVLAIRPLLNEAKRMIAVQRPLESVKLHAWLVSASRAWVWREFLVHTVSWEHERLDMWLTMAVYLATVSRLQRSEGRHSAALVSS